MCKQTTNRTQNNSAQDDVQVGPIINNVIIYRSEFSHIHIIQGVPSINYKATFMLGRLLVTQIFAAIIFILFHFLII
jgi:hypothetical protein